MRRRTPFDLHYRVVPCTVAEVLTFHSVRKELVPAVPGQLIHPYAIFGFKDAGPAFTLGAAGNFQAKWNNTAKTPVTTVTTAGFLDVATATSTVSGFGGSSTVSGNESNAADTAGKSIVSGTNGNVDYAGVGSPIVLVILYRLIPVTGFRVAALTDTGTGPR